MEKINYRLASEKDNAQILDVVESLPMAGDVEVLYKREPNFFDGTKIQGFKYEIVVACNEVGKIVAVGGRTLKYAYVNGKKTVIGYLSDLRISKDHRHLHILANGYSKMKEVMLNNPVYLNLTTIIEDNKLAKAALTWKNRHQSIPNYFDIGQINTFFVLPIFPKRILDNLEIKRGNIAILDDIVSFLNEEGLKKQFFPYYTKEYFLNLKGFDLSDFYVAYENNRIVGVIAKWDQASFKQVVLNAYHGKFKWLKKILRHYLPDEKKEIEHIYLAFNVIKDNDQKIFRNILSRIYSDIYKSKIKYFVVAFHENDPLQHALTGFIKLKYRSRLYIADYKTDEEIKKLIDTRIPYIEVATL